MGNAASWRRKICEQDCSSTTTADAVGPQGFFNLQAPTLCGPPQTQHGHLVPSSFVGLLTVPERSGVWLPLSRAPA